MSIQYCFFDVMEKTLIINNFIDAITFRELQIDEPFLDLLF